jgi:transposase
MDLSKEDIRLLLQFQFKLRPYMSASEAARNVCKAYGDGIVGESTARRWFKKFKDGGESLTDKERSGRPRKIDRQSVIEAIEDNPSMTTRMLADEFDCRHSTIEDILHEAGKHLSIDN